MIFTYICRLNCKYGYVAVQSKWNAKRALDDIWCWSYIVGGHNYRYPWMGNAKSLQYAGWGAKWDQIDISAGDRQCCSARLLDLGPRPTNACPGDWGSGIACQLRLILADYTRICGSPTFISVWWKESSWIVENWPLSICSPPILHIISTVLGRVGNCVLEHLGNRPGGRNGSYILGCISWWRRKIQHDCNGRWLCWIQENNRPIFSKIV